MGGAQGAKSHNLQFAIAENQKDKGPCIICPNPWLQVCSYCWLCRCHAVARMFGALLATCRSGAEGGVEGSQFRPKRLNGFEFQKARQCSHDDANADAGRSNIRF